MIDKRRELERLLDLDPLLDVLAADTEDTRFSPPGKIVLICTRCFGTENLGA